MKPIYALAKIRPGATVFYSENNNTRETEGVWLVEKCLGPWQLALQPGRGARQAYGTGSVWVRFTDLTLYSSFCFAESDLLFHCAQEWL